MRAGGLWRARSGRSRVVHGVERRRTARRAARASRETFAREMTRPQTLARVAARLRADAAPCSSRCQTATAQRPAEPADDRSQTRDPRDDGRRSWVDAGQQPPSQHRDDPTCDIYASRELAACRASGAGRASRAREPDGAASAAVVARTRDRPQCRAQRPSGRAPARSTQPNRRPSRSTPSARCSRAEMERSGRVMGFATVLVS